MNNLNAPAYYSIAPSFLFTILKHRVLFLINYFIYTPAVASSQSLPSFLTPFPLPIASERVLPFSPQKPLWSSGVELISTSALPLRNKELLL